MSLTRVVAEPKTRAFLKARLAVPRIAPPKLLVEPRGGNVQRIGTAFDYALRYGLRARGSARHDGGTVAEAAVETIIPRLAQERVAEARERLSAALDTVEAMAPGRLSDAAADACLELTSLDWVYRSRMTKSLDSTPGPAERTELQALFAVVPWAQLATTDWSILNPTFGAGSRMLGVPTRTSASTEP